MRLPDGSTLMHGSAPYDPVKAREYYLRTRKLKGRKKAAAQLSPADQAAKYKVSLASFLKKLPMAIEGADLKKTEAFVDSFRGKSDDELRAAAKNMKDTPGTKDADIKAKTVLALLANRDRIRKQKTQDKTAAKINAELKGNSPPKVARAAITTKT